MEIKIDKKYKTKGKGLKVEILRIASGVIDKRVIGIIRSSEGYEFDAVWALDGKFLSSTIAKFDDLPDDSKDLVFTSEWDDIKIDDCVMWKRNEGDDWQRGHFAGIRFTGAVQSPTVFLLGATSWTADEGAVESVRFCRKPGQGELLSLLNRSQVS